MAKAQLYRNTTHFTFTVSHLPEYLQALSSLLSHRQALRWGKHHPTPPSPAEAKHECYTFTTKTNIRRIQNTETATLYSSI